MKCPECGTETVYRSARCPKCGKDMETKAAKNVSEDAMSCFFEKNEEKIKSSRGEKNSGPNGMFAKILIAFMIFGALAIAMSFNDGDYDSAVVAIVMTLLFLGAYFMETDVFRVKTHRCKVIVGVVAFALIIPYFALYTPMSSYEEKINPKEVLVLEEKDGEGQEKKSSDKDEMQSASSEMIDNSETDVKSEKIIHPEKTEQEENVFVEEKYEPIQNENKKAEDETATERNSDAIKTEIEAESKTKAKTEKSETVKDEEKSYDNDVTVVGEVYITPTGKKYHMEKSCAGKNAIASSKADVEGKYQPCKKCAQ